jgi:hypothetical protein
LRGVMRAFLLTWQPSTESCVPHGMGTWGRQKSERVRNHLCYVDKLERVPQRKSWSTAAGQSGPPASDHAQDNSSRQHPKPPSGVPGKSYRPSWVPVRIQPAGAETLWKTCVSWRARYCPTKNSLAGSSRQWRSNCNETEPAAPGPVQWQVRPQGSIFHVSNQ